MNAATASGAASAGVNPLLALAITAAIFAAYWLPTFVAWRRHIPALGQVVVVNLFLGWTFLGWVVALVMAFRQPIPATLPAVPEPPERQAPQVADTPASTAVQDARRDWGAP